MVLANQPGEHTGACFLQCTKKISLIPNSTQFTVFICVLFILPTATPVTQLNMNYAIVAIGGVVLIVNLVWMNWGRFHFFGPVRTLNAEQDEDETKA